MDILQTKLRAPPLRTGHIRRPRLFDLLDRGPDARLTLIPGPAGFGRTSRLTDWLIRFDRPSFWQAPMDALA